MDGNSLFGLSYELAADNIPLLVVALAVDILLFLLWRKLINIPAAVLFVLSVIGISLNLIQRFSGNNISSIYLPEWFIFLIGQLSYSLLVGVFIWIVFSYYYEKKRKDIYKNRLSKAYNSFKKDIIQKLLYAYRESCGVDLIDELSDCEDFQIYFKEDHRRWYFLINHLDVDPSFRHDLIIEFQMFEKEISYILNANVSPNEESYNDLCNRSMYITNLKLRYDYIINFQESNFCSFDKYFMDEIWSVLMYWGPYGGRSKEDPVKKVIQEL